MAWANDARNEADLPALAGRHPGENRAAFDARIEEELAREVAAHPDAIFIFSSEHASSRLVHAQCILRLKALLERHFDTIRICVYFRRWDRMAISAYSTFVQSGLASPAPFRHFRDTSYLDYAALLGRWSGAFGHDRMHVAIFDRRELAGGSIVSDFSSRFGLPPLQTREDANTSFDFKEVRTLALINGLLADRALPNAAAVRALIIAGFRKGGGPIPIEPDNARRFNAHYAAQAEAIRAQYFPKRRALFDEDYSGYQLPATPAASNWRNAAEMLTDALHRAVS